MSEFTLLREMLSGGNPDRSRQFGVDAHRRLACALDELPHDTVGEADLGSLVRGVLRRHDEVNGGVARLLVPRGDPWPSREGWRRYGIEAYRVGEHLELSSSAWNPTWLAEGDSIDCAAYGGRQRRPSGISSVADPFLQGVLGSEFTSYSSIGQKVAIRSALAMEPGSTLVVDLPTGSGKSLVAFVPALVNAQEGRLTVVVVPTVTLALDLERRLREITGESTRNFAWIGGQDADQRTELVRRSRDGAQGILIAAPEALLQASDLESMLVAVAGRGRLAALVVDEAHLVSQWGTEFRPAFQHLAALRRRLLAAAESAGHDPLKTVAMSATMTEDSLETIEVFFGKPGAVHTVTSNYLRPEPDYWAVSCTDDDQRRERLLEAVDRLPRPMIIYTLLVDDAISIAEFLGARGYQRIARVTSGTNAASRRAIMEAFSGSRGLPTVDLVVATSAFGLGIDIPNVRSIVHACIPETIDRYYQEVGRSGRDGKASISLVLHTPEDLGPARSISRKTVIGVAKGLGRWKAMFSTAQREGDRLSVSIRTVPRWLNGSSDENEAWNIRTLTLMERAQLIELGRQSLPERLAHETDDDWEMRRQSAYDDFYSHVPVRVVHGSHLEEATWAELVESERTRTSEVDAVQLRRMLEVLEPGVRVCELLQLTYRRERVEGVSIPAISCTNCSACRSIPAKPGYPSPVGVPREIVGSPSQWLVERCGPDRRLVISYDDEVPAARKRRFARDLGKLTAIVMRHGVGNLLLPPNAGDDERFARVYEHAVAGAAFVESTDGVPLVASMPRIPTLIFGTDYGNRSLPSSWVHVAPDAGIRLILVPRTATMWGRPDRRVTEIVAPTVDLDAFLRQAT